MRYKENRLVSSNRVFTNLVLLQLLSAAGPFSVFPICVSQKDTRGVFSTRVLKHNMQGTLERTVTNALRCNLITYCVLHNCVQSQANRSLRSLPDSLLLLAC